MDICKKVSETLAGSISSSAPATYLLAVSGGADSMVLLHVFRQLKLQVAVAHCNFNLRGDESTGDMLFVQEQANLMGFPFHVKSFSADDFGNSGSAVQATARTLRYEWFDELCDLHGYDHIVTAHHADDQAETILHRIIRGTGINGLAGMQVRNNRILRPMLQVSKQELLAWAAEQQIPFRTDSSNALDKYTRNRIRHHIIPAMEQINPSVKTALVQLGSRASELQEHVRMLASEFVKISCITKGQTFLIHKHSLRQHSLYRTLLFELLRNYGFNETQTDLIQQHMDEDSGKRFLSPQFILTIERAYLCIEPAHHEEAAPMIIHSLAANEQVEWNGCLFSFEVTDHQTAFEKDALYLDMDKLEFPLHIRLWQNGDRFVPLGMKGSKKVSDLLVDMKIDLHEKKRVYVLQSGDAIAAVLPYRVSELYKVTAHTKRTLQIRMKI